MPAQRQGQCPPTLLIRGQLLCCTGQAGSAGLQVLDGLGRVVHLSPRVGHKLPEVTGDAIRLGKRLNQAPDAYAHGGQGKQRKQCPKGAAAPGCQPLAAARWGHLLLPSGVMALSTGWEGFGRASTYSGSNLGRQACCTGVVCPGILESISSASWLLAWASKPSHLFHTAAASASLAAAAAAQAQKNSRKGQTEAQECDATQHKAWDCRRQRILHEARDVARGVANSKARREPEHATTCIVTLLCSLVPTSFT